MKNSTKRPPGFLEWLLEKFSPRLDIQEKLGDFEELYFIRRAGHGTISSWLWYLYQIIKMIKMECNYLVYGRLTMLKNYFKTTYRNLLKNKGYSFINILGLSLGLTCCIFIFLYIHDEVSYDRFHENVDNKYRIRVSGTLAGNNFDMATASSPMAHTLKKDYPEVRQAVRLYGIRTDRLISYNNNHFSERICFADSTFFKMFSFQLLKGDANTALKEPFTVVLTKSIAEKFFGDDDPIGKVIIYENETDYKVTGIIEDLPNNTHMDFGLLVSFSSIRESRDPIWISHNYHTYLELIEGVKPEEFEIKIQEMINKYVGPQLRLGMGISLDEFYSSGGALQYHLQPVRDIHLHSDLEFEIEANGDIKYVYLFSSIAFFILIIACINYMNLATAKSAGRAKEVGIRKVVGSRKLQLVGQFISESLILTVSSVLISITAVIVLMPLFNDLSGKNIEPGEFLNMTSLLILSGFILFTGLAAGGYPAFFLASFRPVNVLKGSVTTGKSRNSLRRSLVVIQFAVTIFLFIGTFIVHSQLNFISQRKLGFNKEQVLVLKRAWSLGEHKEVYKNTLLQNENILNSSYTNNVPGESLGNTGIVPEGFSKNETFLLWNLFIDFDFMKTMQIEFVDGRDFSREFSTDAKSVIINETAAEIIGWDNPLGKYMTSIMDKSETKYNVIGIVKDFHYETLHREIRPMVMIINDNISSFMCVRVRSDNITSTISLIEQKWKEFAPGQPFDYYFLDENYNSLYKTEMLTGKLFSIFSMFTIVIACLGLFALVSYVAEKRTKEIGVRKVLGSTITGIVILLSKEFSGWVLLANILAWPSAWFVMNKWLQNFAYRTDISFGLFLIAGLFAFIIALVTVGIQAIKAAYSNPVNALRYE
ncbi:MAG: FtsX-like permease family protein [bacterium]|nr:FtsX-like permease family protein [bacterium]